MFPSDADVKKKVEEQMHNDRRLDASGLRVEVEGGTVTLRGAAATDRDAALAQEDAAGVNGVAEVVDRIKVEFPGKLAPPTDEAIRARIQAALSLDTVRRPVDLVLAVADGMVFMEGFVETLTDKRQVEDIAARQSGVSEVHNNLTVVPSIDRHDDQIAADVRGAMQSDGAPAQGSVSVQVEMGVVTLKGSVPGEAARRRVKEAAASVSGVVEVRDRLRASAGSGDPPV